MRKRDEITNPNGCMFRAGDDEMTFVLLGRDVAAPATIRHWIQVRVLAGKNKYTDPQIIEALECANTMEAERGGEQAAVRSALAPRVGELPELDVTDGERAVAWRIRNEADERNPDRKYLLIVLEEEVTAKLARERQLHASQAEVERLRGELEDSDRKGRELCGAYGNSLIRIGELEGDSMLKVRELGLVITRDRGWVNERAESAELRLTTLQEERDVCDVCCGDGEALGGRDCICGGEGTSSAEKIGLRKAVIEAESALTTCREDERKRCLEAVRGLHKANHVHQVARDYIHISDAQHAKVLDLAEQAIIEIGKGEK